MALFECPECAQEVSSESYACLLCGFSIKPIGADEPEFSGFRRRVLIFCMIFCVIGLPAGLAMGLPYVRVHAVD